MQILRDSFEEQYKIVADEIQRQHFTEQKEEMEQYVYMFQTKLDSVVDLEDELANVEIGKLLKTKNGKIEIAGQIIEFTTKNGKTLKPMLGKVEIKGSLKKKFLATLGIGTNNEEVEMWGKQFTKTTFQYGPLAIAYYMSDWQMNRGFFMRVKTSKINKTTRKRIFDGDRYAYKMEELEDMEIRREKLYEELANLNEEITARQNLQHQN